MGKLSYGGVLRNVAGGWGVGFPGEKELGRFMVERLREWLGHLGVKFQEKKGYITIILGPI